MTPENKGNLITRRAFTDELKEHRNRMRDLYELTGRAISTCYQYTEEVGLYGSGTPSPLHVVIESVKRLHERDVEEGCEISFAQMFAEAPLVYLRQLRGGLPPDCDPIGKLNLLGKNAADATYLLGARSLQDLPLGELREFGRLITNIATIANELGMMIDARIVAIEQTYPGAPIQGERLRAMADTER